MRWEPRQIGTKNCNEMKLIAIRLPYFDKLFSPILKVHFWSHRSPIALLEAKSALSNPIGSEQKQRFPH